MTNIDVDAKLGIIVCHKLLVSSDDKFLKDFFEKVDFEKNQQTTKT